METVEPVSYTNITLNERGEVVSSQTVVAEPGSENSLTIRKAVPDDFRVVAGPAIRGLVETPDMTGVILNQKRTFDPKTGDEVGRHGTVIANGRGHSLSGDLNMITPRQD